MYSTVERDKQAWTSLLAGHQKALSDLFLAYAESLFNFGFVLCRDKEKVEDCLQDLFYELWQNHHKLPVVSSGKMYLMMAIRNKIKGTFRGPVTANMTEADDLGMPVEMNIEDYLIDQEIDRGKQAMLNQAIQNLPIRMKEVIYLRYFENLDYTDISRLMNIQKQVAINMVYRAIAHLRNYSKPYMETLSASILMQLALF
ncbi:MAG: sigma-70 family RNA polymerase sigma factor [Saprospiraceae bacterium]|nr:sigma-70 family RNA polymerase sigma factor [Saprospiraceae bacterium]